MTLELHIFLCANLPLLEKDLTILVLFTIKVTRFTSVDLNEMLLNVPSLTFHESGNSEMNKSFCRVRLFIRESSSP